MAKNLRFCQCLATQYFNDYFTKLCSEDMYIETTLVTICIEVEIKIPVISERQVWNLPKTSTGPEIVPYVDVLNTVKKRLCMRRVEHFRSHFQSHLPVQVARQVSFYVQLVLCYLLLFCFMQLVLSSYLNSLQLLKSLSMDNRHNNQSIRFRKGKLIVAELLARARRARAEHHN